MSSVQDRLERQIRRDFPEPGAAQDVMWALDQLPGEAGYDEDFLRSERIRSAIIFLAGGDIYRFLSATDLAKSDWRDLLIAAGLAQVDWPERLDRVLGRDCSG